MTFQEYFTAQYYAENEARGTLAQLVKHFADSRWREVILLTVAQLPDADAFFELFLERLAADAQKRLRVTALLRQVARKAAAAAGTEMSAAVARSGYLSLLLTFKHALALARDPDLDPARALFLSLDLALTLAHDLDLALTLAVVRDRARERALARRRVLAFKGPVAGGRTLTLERARALERALVLSHSSYSGLVRDVALLNARLMVELVISWPDMGIGTQELLGLAEEFLTVAQAHASDDLPTEEKLVVLADRMKQAAIGSTHGSGPVIVARVVASELDTLLKDEDLVFPTLDDEEYEFVTGYLDGNLLLLECLSQAIVADHEAIKERLLLLPEV